MIKNFVKGIFIFAAIVTAADTRADVSLTLDINDIGNTSSYSGLNANLNGVNDINGGEWIGIYGFTVGPNASPAVSSPFYSICLSPGGNLETGTYSYNSQPIATASQINPGGWVQYGIQNASFLFSHYSQPIVNGNGGSFGLVGTQADQGTALALAIYSALWNSTGTKPGTVGTGTINSGFYIYGSSYGGFGDQSIETDYNSIIAEIGSYTAATGTQVLVPDITDAAGPSGQEFVLLTSQVVPESSTVVAGLLMLLPLGIGAFRFKWKRVLAARGSDPMGT